MSRLSALETAFQILIENPRYVPCEAAGFNGQHHRKRMFAELVQACRFSAIIETGTYIGDTTAYMATTTGLPVHTCEANHTFQALAKSRIQGVSGIHFHHGDSRHCLREILTSGSNRQWLDQPIFAYLDAHWHADLPLVEEITLIATHAKAFVIMVDDFRVDGDSGYGYDNYGSNRSLELATLRPVMRRHRLHAYFPSVPSSDESGGRRGSVVLCTTGPLASALDSLPSLRAISQPA